MVDGAEPGAARVDYALGNTRLQFVHRNRLHAHRFPSGASDRKLATLEYTKSSLPQQIFQNSGLWQIPNASIDPDRRVR